MAYGQSSNTTAWDPFGSELVIEALGRCQVFDIQSKHMQSARRSLNLLLTSAWSNRGINLWRMNLVSMPLIPGVIKYYLDRNVVTVLDCFRRQYSMNGATSYTVDFSTTINRPEITIVIPGNSSPVGSYISIGIPVSVGGLVLYGFYQVVATPTVNSVTVVALTNATATINNGGAVPTFTTTPNSQNVTVTLGDHGYVPGASFPVNVETTVGGIQLQGNYVVQSVPSASTFVILADANAISDQTVPENSGQALISTQNLVAGYTDILMEQLSRTDYAGQANKQAPGAPTTLWVNKQIIPEVSIWPVTDATGPYELFMWAQEQIQDANPTGGQTLNLPPRFYYAMVLDLARDLAMTYAPSKYAELKTEATEAWLAAEGTDIEQGVLTILPDRMPNGLN